MNKRNAIKSVAACALLAGATVLFSACSEKKVEFRGIDVTGAEYASAA
jgi:protein SCO1/2